MRGLILGGAVATMLVACAIDWDRLDPSLGGTGGAVADGGGGSGASGGLGGTGGTGGEPGGGGTGGTPAGTTSTGGGGAMPLGPWASPTPFPFNDPVEDDDDPTFTADGRELYFNSDRPGGHIWLSVRASRSAAWEPPVVAPGLNEPGFESNPVVAPDGLTFWFSARRDGQDTDDRDIYVSTRATRADVWPTPVLATELNMLGAHDYMGSVTADNLTAVMERNGDLYMTTRANPTAMWDTPMPIAELSTMELERQAWISGDGLRLFFDITIGAGVPDLYETVRPDLGSPFAMPELITELATTLGESDAWLSPDLRYMVFMRSMGGNADLFETSR